MGNRRLGLVAGSLLLSALMHGWVLGLPGWPLPQTGDGPAEPLQATLVQAPPRPALTAPAATKPAPPARPKPPRPPKPKRAPPATPPAMPTATLPAPEPVPEATPEPVEVPAEPATESPPEPAPPPQAEAPLPALLPAGGPNWPRKGHIVYDVFRGDKNFLVGRTVHSWEQDGRHYRMESVVETVGLAALLRSFHYVQRSEGRVTAHGLAPERFRVEQSGKPGEGAEFDWNTGEAVVRRAKGKERRAPVRPGDQDVLSIWHQLALMGEPPPHQRLTLVSNKSATPAELEAAGVEALDLPIGHLTAHHLRARALDGSLSLEIWLAEKHGYLPVRILVRDREGEIFDQRAREVFRDGAEGGASATAQENKSNE